MLLSGCGGQNRGNIESMTNSSGTENIAEKQDITKENDEVINVLSKEEFLSYFERVDLTLDNWDNYFYLNTGEKVEKDAFGEPNGSVETYKIIERKENIAIIDDNRPVFRFSGVYTEESGYYSSDGSKISGEEPHESAEEIDVSFYSGDVSNDILEISRNSNDFDDGTITFKSSRNISEMNCTKVKGKILVASIPDSAWINNENGRCIIVEDEEGSYVSLYDDGKYDYNDSGSFNEMFFVGGKLPMFAKWPIVQELLEVQE